MRSVSFGVTFCSLNTHVQSLASELIFTLETSITIPPPAPPEVHFNGPSLEPRSVTVVLCEVTGAPRVTCVVPAGQTRRDAYTDCWSFDCVYLYIRKMQHDNHFVIGNIPNIRVSCVILIFPWDATVNSFTIDFEPRAHLSKTFFEDGCDLSVRCRSNIDQDIATRARQKEQLTLINYSNVRDVST